MPSENLLFLFCCWKEVCLVKLHHFTVPLVHHYTGYLGYYFCEFISLCLITCLFGLFFSWFSKYMLITGLVKWTWNVLPNIHVKQFYEISFCSDFIPLLNYYLKWNLGQCFCVEAWLLLCQNHQQAINTSLNLNLEKKSWN